jgi:thiol-disulfide isomerase/thioredoxin
MKKQNLFLIVVLFMVTQFGFATASEYAIIKGIFGIPEAKVKEITLFKAEDGVPVIAAVSKLNKQGEFGFVIPVTTAGFYYVDYGQFKKRGQLVRLYLEPNLDINLTISEKSYTLTGKNIGKNALVQKANAVYDEFAYYATPFNRVTYDDFYPWLDGGLAKAETFKNSISTKDKSFDKLLKLAVDTDVHNLCYLFFSMPRTKHPAKDNHPAIYKKWQSETKFTDPDLLKLANGIEYMLNFGEYARTNGTIAESRVDYFTNMLPFITDPQVKDAFLRNAIQYFRLRLDEYEKIAPKIRPYLTSEVSKDFLVEYEKELHKGVGQKGIDFTYKDVNDKPVSFSDFKGKYVYIDLWATWCGPCKAEIPHMKKVEEDYHGKNIVFVSLSLDKIKDTQKWKDFVAKEELKGIQLMGDKDFSSDIAKNYEVNAIPRFLLFDTEGKIISINARRPSDPALREELNKLLKV